MPVNAWMDYNRISYVIGTLSTFSWNGFNSFFRRSWSLSSKDLTGGNFLITLCEIPWVFSILEPCFFSNDVRENHLYLRVIWRPYGWLYFFIQLTNSMCIRCMCCLFLNYSSIVYSLFFKNNTNRKSHHVEELCSLILMIRLDICVEAIRSASSVR